MKAVSLSIEPALAMKDSVTAEQRLAFLAAAVARLRADFGSLQVMQSVEAVVSNKGQVTLPGGAADDCFSRHPCRL